MSSDYHNVAYFQHESPSTVFSRVFLPYEQSLSMLYLIMSMLENLRPIPKGLTNPLGIPTADLALFEKLPSDVMNNIILVQLNVKSFRSFRNVNAQAHTSTRRLQDNDAFFTTQALVYQYDMPRTEFNIVIYIPSNKML
ncbi:uncharacterized protein FPRN_07261 [Fusarium proliferatum]|nr:uncharacterized protein FPRN_07261 [Fusarium proliferatum]